jgi:hypothetical protein
VRSFRKFKAISAQHFNLWLKRIRLYLLW